MDVSNADRVVFPEIVAPKATWSPFTNALLEVKHPDALALRGPCVFIDWLRNNPNASVVAAYSLRATVATPLS